jgi:hypothetical protein
MECEADDSALARIPRRSCAIIDLGQSGEIKTSRIVFERGDILFGAIRPYFHKVVSTQRWNEDASHCMGCVQYDEGFDPAI